MLIYKKVPIIHWFELIKLEYSNHKSLFHFLGQFSLSVLVGLIWFLILYGRYPLYFSHVNWIYDSGWLDKLQAQVGWEWFRKVPWSFPIGHIRDYGYPFGTYVVYVNSLLLLSIPLKAISPLLGSHFQFLGIWDLLSVFGQMFIGMLIIKEFTHSYLKQVLGASLLVLSPPMIAQFFVHESLTAHWILLMGIWFVILEYRHKLWRFAWIILFSIAMLVHLYPVVMLIPFWFLGLFYRYQFVKNSYPLIIDILCMVCFLLFVGFGIGLFSIQIKNLTTAGYGNYSWNLIGFFNPYNYSLFIKGISGSLKLFEGFSYLGLGNILIIVISIFLYFRLEYAQHKKFILPLIIISGLFMFFSLSNKAYLGTIKLWDFALPQLLNNLFSVLRASGRFIWPVFYLLVLFGILALIRNSRKSTIVLFLVLALQYIDLQPLINTKKTHGFSVYESKLRSAFWQDATITNKHVILIPISWDLLFVYEPFALYALNNNMTLNWGYFARGDYTAIEEYGEQIWEEIKAGRVDKNTLYILWDGKMVNQIPEKAMEDILICSIDGYDVILSINNDVFQEDPNLIDSCSISIK